jgi:glutamine synthetase type III
MIDKDYSPHESWCDTQNNISTRCNCMVSGYIEQIEELKAELKSVREYHTKVNQDLLAELEQANEKYKLAQEFRLNNIERMRELRAHADKLAAALKVHHTMPGYSEVLAEFEEFKKK